MLTPEQMQKAFTNLGSDLGQKYINDMAKVQMGTPQHQQLRSKYQLFKQQKDAEDAQVVAAKAAEKAAAKADKDAEKKPDTSEFMKATYGTDKETGLYGMLSQFAPTQPGGMSPRSFYDIAAQKGIGPAELQNIQPLTYDGGVPSGFTADPNLISAATLGNKQSIKYPGPESKYDPFLDESMKPKIEAALKQGYSMEEIAAYLGTGMPASYAGTNATVTSDRPGRNPNAYMNTSAGPLYTGK